MNSNIKARRFWTSARVVQSFITLALVTAIGFSGCTGPTPVSNSNSPVANSNNPVSDNSNSNAPNPNAGQPSKTNAASDLNATPPGSKPLPADVLNTELKALDGSTFKLADYRGKVVLVNLWATWCPPCRAEIPDLVKVSQEFKARGVEVIGLTNEDPELVEEKVKDFVREFNITYKIGWGEQDFAVALMQGDFRNNIPQSFVITRDGRVLKRFVGFNRVETPLKLRAALEEAVNEKRG